MSGERTVSIRPRTALQKIASHPQKHAWVSASAGTGKTTVLTDRMLRLMVTGSPPDRILAITFTRAAAAEMLIRLTKTLGGWRALDDFELGYQLRELEIEPTPQRLRRARSLFARALEVPGGLNVQTIHAFAQQLLGAFPVEAGLPPGFVALSDRDSATLQARALSEIIAEAQAGQPVARGSAAAAGQNRQLLDDIGEIVVARGDQKLTRALAAMLPHADALESLKAPAAAAPKLRARLKLPDAPLDEALAAQLDPAAFPEPALAAAIAGARAWNTATGAAWAENLTAFSHLDAAGRAAQRELFVRTALTTNGTPRKVSDAAERKAPGLQAAMAELADAGLALQDLEARYAIADTAARHLRVGFAYAQRYAQLKRAGLAIDYDDMIRRTADLLGQDAGPSWIGYKLDTRFDHILVDEAQDTNEAQWRIIRHLAEDFWAADPDGRRERTLFVVGDYKQAIYGFQGTDPEYFADAHRTAAAAAEDGGRPLEDVSLDKSFRSGPAVLALVDAFLATQATGEGRSALGLDGEVPAHVPDRIDAASQAVLLPVLVPEEAETGEAEREAAERLVAGRLASQIAAWLKPGDPERLWMPAATERGRLSPRYARPSDVMILLRKRSRLMTLLVAALHREGVPVAGVDRLLLREPYAVIDLLALVRFAVQPQDDLNLAELLVSPFLGWDHEDVRALSQGRPADLWGALCRAEGPRVEAARAWLLDALHLAERTTPYEFLDRALSGPLKARARLLARLGVEAVEAIDELLNQALAFEADHPPMHEAFLAWIEAGNVEVKRENDRESQAVRLLTIHGAKGLEAPVVILADAAHDPRPDDSGHVLAALPGLEGEFPIYYPGGTPLPADLAQLRDARRLREAQEDMRLLYVALTRAADHLFVAGAVPASKAGSLGPEDTRWHAKIARAFDRMEAEGRPVEALEMSRFPGTARRIRLGRWTEPDTALTLVPESARHHLHGIDLSPAPPAARGRRTVAPSRLGDDHLAALAPLKERRDARRRGSWLHALFERLPDVPAEQRRARALAWLTAQGARAGDAERLADTALAVIEAPANAELFGLESLAEAPVAGLVNGVGVTGVVDRLLVTPERVRVVDFKTGVAAPASAETAPAAHLKQMAAYAAVLARAFPDRPVEAALLYTAEPKLIALPSALLAGHEPAA